MRKLFAVLFAAVLVLGLGAGTAQALPLSLIEGGAFYLGYYTPNTPSGEGDEENYINALNDYGVGQTLVAGLYGLSYSRVGSTLGGPFPAAVFGTKDGSEGVQSIDATGYSYVVAKYGGGSKAGYSLVWFSSTGFLGEVEPPANYDDNGLSHISLFTRATTTVPDGGMTLMLLGGALVGIGALRRKFSV